MTKARTAALPPQQVDVAIIGAGTAGLMAGAELSARGLRVAIFDPHYVAGGCATQFSRTLGGERYCFDIGLHYVGDCGAEGVMPKLLAGVGIDVDFRPMDADGFDTLIFPDLRFRIPASLEIYRERLLDLFPSEKRGIDRYVRFVEQVGRIGQRIEKNGGRLSAGALFEILTRGRLLAFNQKATIGQFLDSCTKDAKLRAVILGQNGDYALPPSEVAAVLHAGLAAHYFKGAYYPRGGGQIISDRLAESIEARGGSIHLRCGIETILVEDGRAVGVRSEARKGVQHEVRAKAVLSAADLKRTLLELLPREHLPEKWRRRSESYQMAGALFMTFLGVEGDLTDDGMRATNYWQFDDYDFESAYQRARRSDSITPSGCYITSASLKDPGTSGHAPAGKTSLEVMSLVEGDPRKWGVDVNTIEAWRYKKSDAYLEIKQRVEDDMVRRFGELFPSAKDRICFRESATPVSHSRYTRASGGTGYGLACTPQQFLDQRPGYRGPIEGMYLCGVSTRAGHGIVGAMLGGHHAAKSIAHALGASAPASASAQLAHAT
jgi:phytoene dehydrogenase-like protein